MSEPFLERKFGQAHFIQEAKHKILVTHSPAEGILDQGHWHYGSEALNFIVGQLEPDLHVFGHVHESYGQIKIGNTLFVNAAIMDLQYEPVNEPQVIEL